jgi:hypothetical protein
MNTAGEQQWEEVISLTNPVLYGKCDTIALIEAKGRKAYVFNTLGKLYERRFDAPVLSFSVSQTGHLAVILQSSDGYCVEVHSPGSMEAVWRYVISSPNIYPLSADVSPDGRVVALSLLDLNPDAYHSMKTNIVFMYTSQADAASTTDADGKFAGETLSDQIALVRFMNNKLLAVSDKNITCYTVSENVKQDWQIALENELEQFETFGNDGFVIVAGGSDGSKRPEDSSAGMLEFYNIKGKRTGGYQTSGVDYISMSINSVIVGKNRNYEAINNRGKLLWSYTASQDIRQLMFLGYENTALASGATNAWIMRKD